jgi:hypothetical protein
MVVLSQSVALKRLRLVDGAAATGWVENVPRITLSTTDRDVDGQRRCLTDAGAARIFEDLVSGCTFERPGLTELLNYARTGNVLCVVRLDRLGRSLSELLPNLPPQHLTETAGAHSSPKK